MGVAIAARRNKKRDQEREFMESVDAFFAGDDEETDFTHPDPDDDLLGLAVDVKNPRHWPEQYVGERSVAA